MISNPPQLVIKHLALLHHTICPKPVLVTCGRVGQLLLLTLITRLNIIPGFRFTLKNNVGEKSYPCSQTGTSKSPWNLCFFSKCAKKYNIQLEFIARVVFFFSFFWWHSFKGQVLSENLNVTESHHRELVWCAMCWLFYSTFLSLRFFHGVLLWTVAAVRLVWLSRKIFGSAVKVLQHPPCVPNLKRWRCALVCHETLLHRGSKHIIKDDHCGAIKAKPCINSFSRDKTSRLRLFGTKEESHCRHSPLASGVHPRQNVTRNPHRVRMLHSAVRVLPSSCPLCCTYVWRKAMKKHFLTLTRPRCQLP